MRAVRQTDTADSDDPSCADESEFFVGAIHHHDKLPIDDVWRQNLYVHGQTVSFLLDTGSEVNIMPMAIYRSLHVPDKSLQPSPTRLSGLFGGKATPVGQTQLQCQIKGRIQSLTFLILEKGEPVLGKRACEALGLLQRVYTLISHDSVFEGPGCMYDHPVTIRIAEDATPYCVNAPRRIPIPLMPQLKEELKQLETQGIVQRINEPTDWCSHCQSTKEKWKNSTMCRSTSA